MPNIGYNFITRKFFSNDFNKNIEKLITKSGNYYYLCIRESNTIII